MANQTNDLVLVLYQPGDFQV